MAPDVEMLVQRAIEAPTDDAREAAIDALCMAVRQLECEDGDPLAPVERELPRLAEYLVDDYGLCSAYAISIFRRVRLDRASIESLLRLWRRAPDGRLIEALGLARSEAWTDEVEPTLRGALEHAATRGPAVYALYGHATSLRDEDTLHALSAALEGSDGVTHGRVLFALASSLEGPLRDEGIAILGGALEELQPASRAQLATALGAMTSRGLALLERLARDPDASVRAAAATALVRRHRGAPRALVLLDQLQSDPDPAVRTAATPREPGA